MGAILDLPSPDWFGDYDSQVTVHIIDSSRPQNLATLFGAGENGDRIIIWDDGGAEKLEEERKAWEAIMVSLFVAFVFLSSGTFANRCMDLQLDPGSDSDEDSDMDSDGGGPSGGEDEDGDVDVDGDDEEYGEDGRPGKRRSVGGSGQGTRKRRRIERVGRFNSPQPSQTYNTQATTQAVR
jgi:cell division control protein 45